MFKKIILSFFLLNFSFFNFIYAADIEEIEKNAKSLDDYLTFEYNDVQKVLNTFSDKLMLSWRSDIYNGKWSKENDAVILIRMANNKNRWEFLVFEYPLEVSVEVGKNIIEFVRLLSGDAGGIIEKIENLTVEKAVDYAMNELFKSEIKVGSGALEGEYTAQDGEKVRPIFQYLVAFQEIGYDKNEVIIRFYSIDKLKIPEKRGGISLASIQSFVSKDYIAPFILTARGEMNSKYEWINDPEIKVEYPDKVEDFGFKHVSVWERIIFEPLQTAYTNVQKFFSVFDTSIFDVFTKKQTEIVENSPELSGITEEIKEQEKLIEERIEEAHLPTNSNINEPLQVFEKTEREKENYEDKNQQNIVEIDDNMTVEEMKEILIAIYKELEKRKKAEMEVEKYKENEENLAEEKQGEENDESEHKKVKITKNENKDDRSITYCVNSGGMGTRSGIIFNEISWMGTDSSSDEWIELKNIGDSIINLDGYQLLDKDNQINVIFDAISLDRGEYLLLERTDDDSVPGVSADLFYTGGLSNKDEALYLFNPLCELQDIVLADPDWPAGNSNERKSMERGKDLTWHTYNGSSFGTPKNKNSEALSVSLGGGSEGGEDSKDIEISANAGEDIEVTAGGIGQLNGSASIEFVYYFWECDEEIILDDYNISNPSFIAPNIIDNRNYACNLTVFDDDGRNDVDSIKIKVLTAPISFCSQKELDEATHSPVVINEIAWMGTDVDYSDEWIELRNVTSEEISLSGYQLIDKKEQIKIIFTDEDVISAYGFYLLEKDDDNSVPDIPHDMIYKGTLSNEDESLRLFNEKCFLIDEVLADPDWPAGDNEEKKSMERTLSFSWQTHYGEGYSTPKDENSTPNALTNAESYCLDQGYLLENEEDATYCTFGEGDRCLVEYFYKGTCGDGYAHATELDHLIITLLDDGYGNDEREYVKLFNQTGENVPFCIDDKCIHIAYFSNKDSEEFAWNMPNIIYSLPDEVIVDREQYQIDFSYDNRGNIKITDCIDDYFYSNTGSVCLFSEDVTLLDEISAEKAKIDCLGWGISGYKNDIAEEDFLYRNKNSDKGDERKLAMQRKIDKSNNLFYDRDNNSVDFEHISPPVYTVPQVLNFHYIELGDKTKIYLSWDYEEFLNLENLSFKIYYTENVSISEDALNEILPETVEINGNNVKVLIPAIKEGVDYRFYIKIFEEDGNVSQISEALFYQYLSSFDVFPYGIFRYNTNKTNKAEFSGPEIIDDFSTFLSLDEDDFVSTNPCIDNLGNLYLILDIDDKEGVYSFDVKGNLRWFYVFPDSGSYLDSTVYLLNGKVYILSRGKISVFNYRGEFEWDKNVDIVNHPKDVVNYYQKKFYYPCLTPSLNLCRVGVESNDEQEVIYNANGNLGERLIFNLDTIFIIQDNILKEIFLDGGSIRSKEFPGEIKNFEIFGNTALILTWEELEKNSVNYYLLDLMDFDKDISPILSFSNRITEKIIISDSKFYIFRNSYGKSHVYYVDPITSVVGDLKSMLEFFPVNKPLIDINQKMYILSDRRISCYYHGEEDILEEVFNVSKSKYSGNIEITLINGKLYYNNKNKLMVLDF